MIKTNLVKTFLGSFSLILAAVLFTGGIFFWNKTEAAPPGGGAAGPVFSVLGFTANGAPLAETDGGYALRTDDISLTEYAVDFSSGTVTDKALVGNYFPFTLSGLSDETKAVLKDYYDNRPMTDDRRNYYKDAVDGINPFLYVRGNGDVTANMVDAYQATLGGADQSFLFYGDFPEGEYSVQGNIMDFDGNMTMKSFKFIIDRTAPSITIVGSQSVKIYKGSFYTDPGAAAADNTDGDITTKIVTTSSVDMAVPGSYSVIYGVTDAAGNQMTSARVVEVLAVSETAQVLAANTTVSATTPDIMISSNNTADSNISVPGTVTNATLNVSSLTTTTATMTSVIMPGAITIDAVTAVGSVKVEIPAGMQINAETPAWNGVINLPQTKDNSGTGIVPGSGNNLSIAGVIEVGYGDVKLTFDRAVRLLLVGQAGKELGYSRSGVFTKIENTCSADTQSAGDTLPAGGDCKINVGADLAVWTKHFTSFVTYSESRITYGGYSAFDHGIIVPTTNPPATEQAKTAGSFSAANALKAINENKPAAVNETEPKKVVKPPTIPTEQKPIISTEEGPVAAQTAPVLPVVATNSNPTLTASLSRIVSLGTGDNLVAFLALLSFFGVVAFSSHYTYQKTRK
jgi:hypothetical protein